MSNEQDVYDLAQLVDTLITELPRLHGALEQFSGPLEDLHALQLQLSESVQALQLVNIGSRAITDPEKKQQRDKATADRIQEVTNGTVDDIRVVLQQLSEMLPGLAEVLSQVQGNQLL